MNTLSIVIAIVALLLVVKCDQRVVENSTGLSPSSTTQTLKLGSLETSIPSWYQDSSNDLGNMSWDGSTKDAAPKPVPAPAPVPQNNHRWEAVKVKDTPYKTPEPQKEEKQSKWQAVKIEDH